MQHSSILDKLKVDCPFPEIFEDKVIKNGLPEYRRKSDISELIMTTIDGGIPYGPSIESYLHQKLQRK